MSQEIGKSLLRFRHLAGVVAWCIAVSPWTMVTAFEPPDSQSPQGGEARTSLPQTAAELAVMRAENDDKYWKDEVLAQNYERTLTKLWDELIFESDKFGVLRKQQFDRLEIGMPVVQKDLDWGIQVIRLTGPAMAIPAKDWSDWLADFQLAGVQIIETEWHHKTFDPAEGDQPARSTVSFVIHAVNVSKNERYIVRGVLRIEWSDRTYKDKRRIPAIIRAEDVVILARGGEPSFDQVRDEVLVRGPNRVRRMRPAKQLIIHDLDRDGLPEVVIGGANKVYRNKGNWEFAVEKLCEHPVAIPDAGVFADFSGDGVDDYLCLPRNEVPKLFAGTTQGTFPSPPKIVDAITEPFVDPTVITAGDVDGDGDLDAFIGQLKMAYDNGQIPTRYFDAKDGYPAYLLLNNGDGTFVDVTEDCGIGDKRFRRMFSASLVDLDEDGDLDLMTTNDFAGTDLFFNDGSGKFVDSSDRLTPKGYAFGMSHSFGDYNMDGHLDFMLIGMSSTTARRLENMKLGRDDFPEHNAARMLMGYGNRLYLGDGKGNFSQAPFNDTVARTGWSWGSTTLDFDNDADADLFIVNGQMSGKTTQDYCTRFWCHDIYYTDDNRPDKAIQDFFAKMGGAYAQQLVSWNGYEHNALLMNLGGKEFVNVAFLMGVSHEVDSRAAVSGDLDADGRVDLLFEQFDMPRRRSKVFFLRNQHASQNHWIGLRLESHRGDVSPWGAKVVAHLSDGRQLLQHNVTGHSVWAQHASAIHFGLGETGNVERVIVRWPNGQQTSLNAPEVNKYHVVRPPGSAENHRVSRAR